MDKKVLEKIIQLISVSMPGVDVTNVNENTRLIEELRFDSLGLFTLVTNIEKEFNVKFNVTYHISTVKDIYDFIR